METTPLNQARFLHRTIKQLQKLMVKNYGPVTLECAEGSVELTTTQLTTLTAIRDRGEMTLKEIATATHVSPPSASTMVDKLVHAGALNREHSKIDRREVRVSISSRGTQAVEAFEEHFLETLTQIIEGVGPEYAQKWCTVYERIEQHVQETELANHRENTLATRNIALGAN